MSKFEQLCKAYAASRQAYRESCQACLDFSEFFIKQMSDYLECPIHNQNPKFDEEGVLHFDTAIDICENPENPEKGDRYTVEIYLSVNKVIDNFIVTVYPWVRNSRFRSMRSDTLKKLMSTFLIHSNQLISAQANYRQHPILYLFKD